LAVANYRSVYKHYPPAYVADQNGRPMHSWRVLILPFLEQQSLFEQYDFSQPWNSPHNLKLADKMPATYAFHGKYRPGLTTTNYLAVVGEQTLWTGARGRKSRAVSDDRASTILLIENDGLEIHWLQPRDVSFDSMSFQINHPAGLSSPYERPAVATDDGTVFEIGDDVTPQTLRAMLTANGGEEIPQQGGAVKLLPDGRDREMRKEIRRAKHAAGP
jgi:hypothetical protein